MPTPYSPGAGSENPRLRCFALEKRVGNLDQNARPIASSADRSRKLLDELG